MSEDLSAPHAKLQHARYQLLDAARAQGFKAYEPPLGPSFHTIGFQIRVNGLVGKNKFSATYEIVYCPIQDKIVSHKDEDVFMEDFPRFDEFVAKTKAIDAIFDQLAPEKEIVLDDRTSCLTGRTK